MTRCERFDRRLRAADVGEQNRIVGHQRQHIVHRLQQAGELPSLRIDDRHAPLERELAVLLPHHEKGGGVVGVPDADDEAGPALHEAEDGDIGQILGQGQAGGRSGTILSAIISVAPSEGAGRPDRLVERIPGNPGGEAARVFLSIWGNPFAAIVARSSFEAISV